MDVSGRGSRRVECRTFTCTYLHLYYLYLCMYLRVYLCVYLYLYHYLLALGQGLVRTTQLLRFVTNRPVNLRASQKEVG